MRFSFRPNVLIASFLTCAEISFSFASVRCCASHPSGSRPIPLTLPRLAPSACSGPENLQFHAVFNWLQVSWLLTSPLVTYGMGSKDVGNSIGLGGAAFQSSLVVLPTPSQVHRSSHSIM
jgi:hypothetical protein